MTVSTNVENNNAFIVFMDMKQKQKGKGYNIEIGKHGEKNADGDYEIKLSNGKVVTTDSNAKKRKEKYEKNLNNMLEKYRGKDKEER